MGINVSMFPTMLRSGKNPGSRLVNHLGYVNTCMWEGLLSPCENKNPYVEVYVSLFPAF